MKNNNLLIVMYLIAFISFALLGCSFNKTDSEQVKGIGLTYSEYFKNFDGLDERENITYYKPIPMDQVGSSLPEVKNAITSIESDRLPFTVDEEVAYLITSKDENGNKKKQIQLSYLSKSEYDQVDDFFIVSITEVDENPLKGNDISDTQDSVGNALKKEILTEDIPIYQQVITTNSALVYSYYDYDASENSIVTVGTAANEFYTYYNGYIYHIGYVIDREKNDEEMKEKMLHLAREYILGNSL